MVKAGLLGNQAGLNLVVNQVIGGIQVAVLSKPMHGSMYIIGTGLGRDVVQATGRVPIFCAELVGDNGQVRNGIIYDGGSAARDGHIIVVCAVNRKAVCPRTHTAY